MDLITFQEAGHSVAPITRDFYKGKNKKTRTGVQDTFYLLQHYNWNVKEKLVCMAFHEAGQTAELIPEAIPFKFDFPALTM